MGGSEFREEEEEREGGSCVSTAVRQGLVPTRAGFGDVYMDGAEAEGQVEESGVMSFGRKLR